MRVYITHICIYAGFQAKPTGMHDKQLVIVTVFCYMDEASSVAAPKIDCKEIRLPFGYLNPPVGCHDGAGGFFVYPSVFSY